MQCGGIEVFDTECTEIGDEGGSQMSDPRAGVEIRISAVSRSRSHFQPFERHSGEGEEVVIPVYFTKLLQETQIQAEARQCFQKAPESP